MAPPVTIVGGDELRRKLAQWKQRAQAAANAALYQRALQILAMSQRLVPVKYGRLRASGYVQQPDASGKLLMGYSASYALPVHENLSAHHEVGQAKFLETALDQARPNNTAWLKAKTIENLRKGVGITPPPAEE